MSIYMEYGELPLSLWRDLLLCSYTAGLMAHLHHPSYGVVFCPLLHYRYETSIRDP